VNTHLEIKEPEPANPLSRIFQSIQAAELIEWLDVLQQERPFTPLIVVGDMNSSPEDEPVFDIIIPPYQRVVAAGYADIWTLQPGRVPGFTCCQAEDLTNRRSTLDERIDMIFSSDLPRRVKQARLVGDRTSDRTWPPGRGLWPSDHAGVVVTLEFE
jgi:endonuclease/exonuclease/phosphatase family metal-dependent hydrolase